MSRSVVDTIAEMAVNTRQPAVNWVASDGRRRWKFGRNYKSVFTDEEAVAYLRRSHSSRRTSLSGRKQSLFLES